MSQTPPPGYNMPDIWLYDLKCPDGHPFRKCLRELDGADHVQCGICGKRADLGRHKADIGDAIKQAAEIDKEGSKPD
jgi:hypothetical protein